MAAKTIRELLVKLGVKADVKGLQKMQKGVKDLKANVGKLLVVGAAATVGLGLMLKRYADVGDEAIKTADKLGLSVEALQELEFAADRSGVNVTTFRMALQRMTRRVSEAGKDTGEAKDAIKELGLNAKELVKLSPDEMLMRVAGAMQHVKSDSDRLRLAFKLFDSEGVALVNMLRDGDVALENLRREAREIGFVMSEEAARAAVEFKDRLLETKLAMIGLRNVAAEVLLPILTRMMTSWKEWFKLNKDVIAQKIKQWATIVADGIERLAGWVKKLDEFVENSDGGWKQLIGNLEKIALTLGATKGAWMILGPLIDLFAGAMTAAGVIGGGVFAGILIAVLGLVVQLAIMVVMWGALVLVIQDFAVWMRGGESAIGRFIEKGKEAGGILGAIAEKLETVATVAAVVIEKLAAAWTWLSDKILSPVFGWIGRQLKVIGGWIEKFIIWRLNLGTRRLQKLMELFGMEGSASAGAGGMTPAVAGASSTTNIRESSMSNSPEFNISGVGMTIREVDDFVTRQEDRAIRSLEADVEGAEQ